MSIEFVPAEYKLTLEKPATIKLELTPGDAALALAALARCRPGGLGVGSEKFRQTDMEGLVLALRSAVLSAGVPMPALMDMLKLLSFAVQGPGSLADWTAISKFKQQINEVAEFEQKQNFCRDCV